jgi:hypothetical protein
VVVADILPDVADRFDDRLIVWDKTRDSSGAEPKGIWYDAETRTITHTTDGGCGR